MLNLDLETCSFFFLGMGYLQCLEARQSFLGFLVLYLHSTIKTTGSPKVVVSIYYGVKGFRPNLPRWNLCNSVVVGAQFSHEGFRWMVHWWVLGHKVQFWRVFIRKQVLPWTAQGSLCGNFIEHFLFWHLVPSLTLSKTVESYGMCGLFLTMKICHFTRHKVTQYKAHALPYVIKERGGGCVSFEVCFLVLSRLYAWGSIYLIVYIFDSPCHQPTSEMQRLT
jgi:hypothetical protein